MKTRPEAPGKMPQGEVRLDRILVPVDFSPCSEKALIHAKALAAQFGAQLVLLNVVEPFSPTGDLALDLARINIDQEKTAKDSLESYRRAAGKGTKAIVRTGSPARAITEEARHLAADLLVIATHGRTGLAHVALGSVAERVIRHAPCPVLVIREKADDFIVPAPRNFETKRVGRPRNNKPTISEEL